MLDSLRRRPLIEQLDVTTVWSNLSIGIAEMLFEMNRVIGPCLEGLLATRLETLDNATRQEYSPFKGNLSGELNDTHPLLFSLGDLIDSMLEKMQFRCYHHMSLQSPDVLLELMMLYLISLNNIDEYNGSATSDAVIHVGLRPGSDILSDVVPPPIAHVVQQLDHLSFPNLDVMPREGTTITIVPQYSRGVFNKTNDSYSEVSYVMESKPSWLEWDDEISGWKGNLPLYSEWRGISKNSEEVISGGRVGPYAVVNLLRLEVKAVLVERHSSASVRLKRIVRARLTIKVIPWYAHENSHAPHGHPQPQKSKTATYNDDWLTPSPLPQSKPDFSPTLRGKYNDNRFGLGSDKAVLDTVSLRDVQVYRLADPHLDWSPSALRNIPSEHMHEVRQYRAPSLDSSMPRASDEAEAWSTQEATPIPRGSDLDVSGHFLVDDPISSRDASSGTSYSSNRSQRIPSRQNRENWSPNDSSLDTGDRDHCLVHNATERQCLDHGGEAAQAAKHGIQFNDGQTQAEDDELHWQDSAEFDSEFFDEHDRYARRQSLHHASPEVFGLAEVLHKMRSQMQEGSAIERVEYESPSPVQLPRLRVGGDKDEDEANPESNPHTASRVRFSLNRYHALLNLEEQDNRQFQPSEQLPTPNSERMETGQHLKEDSGYGEDTAIDNSHSEQSIAKTLANLDSRRTSMLDPMADDPQLLREQELLRNMLTNKESNGDHDHKRGTRDRKLEAEEKKGLWEVLKWEARQKQRNGVSEETLGMESTDDGEDISSRGVPSGSSFRFELDEEEIQGSWNFGC